MAAADGAIVRMTNYKGPGLLDLSNQGLHKLDSKFVCPADTRCLILDQNHIIKLEHLEHNDALQQLSVASNRLVRMMGVSKLIHLRVLNLPNNSIGYIEGLKDVIHLEWLNLAGNNIKVIEQLCSCVSLQHLDLSDNNISQTGDLTKLSALKTLLLHGNIITTLRTVPAHLPSSLTVLSLAENEIRDLAELSYLAPLHNLEQLSVMCNPCVMATPMVPGCDYRPYVVSWCLNLKVLDGYVVSQKEGLKAEWLYSQGKGRIFRPGQHAQLVQYLASTCPLTAIGALQSAEDAKLERILNKQRQHQQQLQQTRPCDSLSLSRPTHLDVQQHCVHKSKDEAADVIAPADVDAGIQRNMRIGAACLPAITATHPPPTDEDCTVLQDVSADEEKLHGSLLSSESAFLPFTNALLPPLALDSGEEELDDSLAPATSVQCRSSEEDSVKVGSASLSCQSYRSDHLSHMDKMTPSNTDGRLRVLNDEVLTPLDNVDCSRIQKAATSHEAGCSELHEAAVRIQSWWRGIWTRHNHPHAREVRAEIRLRRMQEHIIHLSGELKRLRKQQEEERLQRHVQEEAVKFMWKQLQAVLLWQASVNQQLIASVPPAASIRTQNSISESGFHSPGEQQVALESSLCNNATPGIVKSLHSLLPVMSPSGDSRDSSLLEQYLSSVQQREEEEDARGTGDGPLMQSNLSQHPNMELLFSPEVDRLKVAESEHGCMEA